MHTGMLWYDDDSRATLDSKIQKAAQYYKNKYGRLPDLCLVHPAMLSGGQLSARQSTITVRAYRPVLPGHIWIGVEDQG